MPFNISACLSMESQGYPLKSNVVYQYNQGKIHMESNVRSSCTGNYCHIQISYFFVNYRQYRGGVSIYYCPTCKMLSVCFTNPLQGRLFNVFRKIIMVCKHVSKLEKLLPTPSKDRVGEMDEIENTNFSFNT